MLLLSFAIDIVAMVLAMPRALFPEVAARAVRRRRGGRLAVRAIAIGSVLAGLTSGWIGRVRRQGVALVVAVVGWGLAVAAGRAARSSGWWCCCSRSAARPTWSARSTGSRSCRSYAPDRLRGRLQGVFIVVVAGGPRLGDLRAGATAAWSGRPSPGSAAGSLAAGLALRARGVLPGPAALPAGTAMARTG